MRVYSAVAGALLLAACYHGPSIDTFDPVHRPTGVDADLRLEKKRVGGELLEVQDTTTLIVLTDSGKVVSVPVRGIRSGAFDKLGVMIGEGIDLQPALTTLRSFSRFPFGLTPELRARLLATYGQTEVEVVR
ncbi:MAG TPA: hypothetical protein VF873_07700 [Gemmatimonadales bacterium]